MTLGGLAIAVGLLVDASIIVVENVVHRITAHRDAARRREQALAAAIEVGRPIAFATAIVVAVFVPLFGLSGIEGRMYRPLAAAVIATVLASLVLALTLVPVLAALVLRPRRPELPEDVALVRRAEGSATRRRSTRACATPARARLGALALAVPALALALWIGSDFMPALDEGAFLLQTNLPPEASLEEVDRLNHRVEDVLREFPEVEDVVRRTGRAERTEDPMPHTLSDVLVVLRRGSRALARGARGGDARARRARAGRVDAVHDAARHADRRGARRHARGSLGAHLRPRSRRARAARRRGARRDRGGRRDRRPARRAR